MAKKIEKYIVLAVVSLGIFVSFCFVLNEFQAKPDTELTVVLPVGRFHQSASVLRPLLLISPFISALTIAGLYIFWRRVKHPVIIKTVSAPLDIKGYERLKVLRGNERLVISTIVRSGGKILQKELTAIIKLPSYKITRILNKLERLGVIAREKYGMTNIIHLKFEPKDMQNYTLK